MSLQVKLICNKCKCVFYVNKKTAAKHKNDAILCRNCRISETKKNKSEKAFDDKNIGKSLLDVGVSVTSILDNVSSLFSPGNIIKEAVLKIINFIKQ